MDDVLRQSAKAKLLPELTPRPTIGRFTVTGQLGRGGMGVVYAGYDPELHRPVAIKLVTPVTDDPAMQRRLKREAQAMAKLSHPHVAQVHDVGEHDGKLYVAMEFVEGQPLDGWLAGRRPGLWSLLEVFIQAGRGLAAAHAVGLVHRDFKPANVIVGRDERARVLDFGLARAEPLPVADVQALETTLARAEVRAEAGASIDALAGTPSYMSAEQLRGAPATAKSDQFAFCVALFEALTGVRPFSGETFADLASQVLNGKQREVDRALAPPWLWEVLERGLQADMDARFDDMDALLDALERGRLERGLGPDGTDRLSRSSLARSLVAFGVIAVGAGSLGGIAAMQSVELGAAVNVVGALLLGVVLLLVIFSRGSLRRFGRPRQTFTLPTSAPADEVLALFVRNAGRLDYAVDDQDWSAQELCLRVRARLSSWGVLIRVRVADGDRVQVHLDVRPIVLVDMGYRWAIYKTVNRIRGMLGEHRTYPPNPA